MSTVMSGKEEGRGDGAGPFRGKKKNRASLSIPKKLERFLHAHTWMRERNALFQKDKRVLNEEKGEEGSI